MADGIISQELEHTLSTLHSIRAGKKFGFSTGFPKLDRQVGTIGPGQIWILGGYNGTGKSYVVVNMVEKQLQLPKEECPKIAIFSTELSKQEYIFRWIFMRAGIFKLQYQLEPEKYESLVFDATRSFFAENTLDTEELRIFGNISQFEQIWEYLVILRSDGQLPNIIYIDYIQDLAISEHYDEKDTMPLLGKRIKDMAKEFGIAIVCVSQVNNYTQQKGFSQDNSALMPFSNAKVLANAAHCAIAFHRKINESQKSSHLQASIVKARDGQTGKLNFEILGGYEIIEIDVKRGKSLDATVDDSQDYSHYFKKDDDFEEKL